MAKMGTVWDRTAEFLSDNLGAILPVALLAFFVPASIEGSFQAAKTGGGPELVLSLYAVQLAFGILSLWGSLTISAMALDMASARGANAGLGPQIAGGIALYGLVLLGLLLWIGARLLITNAVIVREKRMFSALRQSWKLTRGMTWRIIGVILLFALVSWVSMLAANMVFGSIFALVTGGPAEGITLAGVLTSIVVAAVQTGFTVLVPAFTAKLYLALAADAGLREGAFRA